MAPQKDSIIKHVLKNGLTILIRPLHLIPKVSTQLWYNVGSKDEKQGERGIAHLIEHMIFKGTKKLTESDINMITYKLSGYCNAFTSYDYTGYLFDFPSHHWMQALEIMADCMRNCTFKEELLASEMKAVIQELKMYKDDYASSLVEEMISTIFADHPYHYPVIGFKQDLWSLKRDALLKFYQEHYIPNNATLVVVGDVQPEKVIEKAEKFFGPIAANDQYQNLQYYTTTDIGSKSVTLYRDVAQSTLVVSWVAPGAHEQLDYYFDVLSWMLGIGKDARLYRLLVDELQIATDVEAFCYDLFDRSLFFIYIQPKHEKHIPQILEQITLTIKSLTEKITDDELLRAMNQAKSQYFSLLENNQKQAYVIGQSYLATGNDQFLFTYLKHDASDVTRVLHELLTNYFRHSLMHIGKVLPLEKDDKDYWKKVQEISDKEDEQILKRVQRTLPVEQGNEVHKINVEKPYPFVFPRAQHITLSNKLPVYYYNNPNVGRIFLALSLKAKYYFDPAHLEGLYAFMCTAIAEGTKRYSATELARAIEIRGMSLSITPGNISINMLSPDLAFGLEILLEILTNATFPQIGIEKVRGQLIADLKEYWDTPSAFAGQLARQQIYKDHPYSKNVLGNFESIGSIRRQDLLQAYADFISPDGAALAISGYLNKHDVPAMLEKTLGKWQGKPVTDLKFPHINHIKNGEVIYPINRDQIVLTYASPSISRFDEAFDKILLFDQFFTGGILGSMHSRLFALREQSGLFYTISGSLLAGSDEQPGMIFIRTIVSLDRLKEAQEAIENTIEHATDNISDQELQEAKLAIINSLVDHFATNKNIANTFLLMHRFNLASDYFDKRALQLDAIKAEDIAPAVKKILRNKNMIKIIIGRLEQKV